MAFIPLKNFLSIRHFKLIGLIGPRAVGERVKYMQDQFLSAFIKKNSKSRWLFSKDRKNPPGFNFLFLTACLLHTLQLVIIYIYVKSMQKCYNKNI